MYVQSVYTSFDVSQRDVRNIDHQTSQKWGKQINENEDKLLDQTETRYQMIFSWQCRLKCCRFCLRNNAERSGKDVRQSGGKIFPVIICMLSILLFLSRLCERSPLNVSRAERGRARCTPVSGKTPAYISPGKFREFFPPVKRSVPLKILATVSRELFLLRKDGKRGPAGKIKSDSRSAPPPLHPRAKTNKSRVKTADRYLAQKIQKFARISMNSIRVPFITRRKFDKSARRLLRPKWIAFRSATGADGQHSFLFRKYDPSQVDESRRNVSMAINVPCPRSLRGLSNLSVE